MARETQSEELATMAAKGKPRKPDLRPDLEVPPLVHQSLAQFRKTVGLAAVLVPASAPNKPIRYGIQENEFCRRVWNSCEGGCAECYQTQQKLLRRFERKLKTHSLCCAAGIVQLAVPVVVRGKHVATVMGGKVRVQPASRAQFRALARRLGLQGTPAELRAMEAAYLQSHLLPPAKLRAAVRLLETLARLFAETISHHPFPEARPQSPYVAQAMAYVQNHLTERVTTRQVAQALNINSSYFCRLFRRLTGMTFHAYLAQARVEAVKAKLLATPSRITEICYVAGFQSVSDFNRVFRAQVGTSPSQFRRTAGRCLNQS